MRTTFPEATHTHAILSAMARGTPGRGAILNCGSLHSFLDWAAFVHAAHHAKRVGAPPPEGNAFRPVGPSKTLGARKSGESYSVTPEDCRLPESVSSKFLEEAEVSWIAFRNKEGADAGYQFIGAAVSRALAATTGRKITLVAVGDLPLVCDELKATASFQETSSAVTLRGWEYTREGPASRKLLQAVVMPGLLDLPSSYKYTPTTQTVVLA